MDKYALLRKELIDVTLRLSAKDEVRQTAIHSLKIARFDGETDPSHGIFSPCLCLIMQGTKEITVSGKTYVYSPTEYLIGSVDLPLTGRVTEASEDRGSGEVGQHEHILVPQAL